MKYLNEVKGARPLGGFRLRVVFRDGYVGDVDMAALASHPRGPLEEPFRDESFFQQVTVDPELGVATWPNGYDICADVLRYYCEVGRMTSDEEMNAYFSSETASVLHDKPKS